MIEILIGIIERGLIFSLIVAAVYLTSRIIKFDDLTVEGSFGIGGALTAICLLHTIGWFPSTIIALIGGAFAGLCTGLLYTKMNLNNLISGIIVTTGLFSITLKIGGSNVALPNIQTPFGKFLFLVPIIIGIFFIIRWFLKTEIGFLLHAVGDNPSMLATLGKSKEKYVIIALVLANMLTALAGSLFVQYTGYFSIWSNVGILVISLAGLIIGQLFESRFGFALIIGAIVYQALIAITFELHIDQEWNKLVTAVLIIGLLALGKKRKINHAKT